MRLGPEDVVFMKEDDHLQCVKIPKVGMAGGVKVTDQADPSSLMAALTKPYFQRGLLGSSLLVVEIITTMRSRLIVGLHVDRMDETFESALYALAREEML
jgi:hypothetical protein